jgi:hypothetical protein
MTTHAGRMTTHAGRMTTHAGRMEDARAHAGALPSAPAPEMTGMRRSAETLECTWAPAGASGSGGTGGSARSAGPARSEIDALYHNRNDVTS